MTRQKPLLFLDVDGVLNVFDESYEKRKIEIPGESLPHYIYPSAHTIPFMRWAWDQFVVFWCTAWGEDANVIAEWAKLAAKPCAADRRSLAEDWKLAGVKAVLKGTTRRAVWIEDGIGDEAEAWVAKRKNFFYVHTDHKIGVTRSHAACLADWLGLSMEAWK